MPVAASPRPSGRSPPTSTPDQKAALLDDPSVVAVVPDEIIHLTAQTIPTGVSRVGARVSSVADIDGSDSARRRRRRDRRHGDRPASRPEHRGRLQLLVLEPRRPGPTATGTARTSRARSAALDNDFGVVGVAPGARLWAVRILNADGYGKLSWYVCGLDWILAQRDPNDASRPLIEAVNMSVAKDGKDDENCGTSNKDVLHQAICRLVKGGITVVAAAANDCGSAIAPGARRRTTRSSRSRRWPTRTGSRAASAASAATRGARYDKDDTFANFSNYGHDVDLIAPGKCIWSTKPGQHVRVLVGDVDGGPRGDRRGRALQGEPADGDPDRGQGGAPVPRHARLEDLDRPGHPPREAARRLEAGTARLVLGECRSARRSSARTAA